MNKVEKTVFISYRRTNIPWVLSIYQNLTHHGFDVFFDYKGIASGDFEQVILANIKARAHFLVLLTPSSLESCNDPSDWLRREIETALDTKRNIVPIMLEGFNFASPAIANRLTGKLSKLNRYNTLRVPADYFDEAMRRLRKKYLNIRIDAVLHPPSAAAKQGAKVEQAAASMAAPVKVQDLTAQEWFEQGCDAVDRDEAARFYTQAIRLNPDFADAYSRRANIRAGFGDFYGAIQDYDEAIRLNPDDADAYILRGFAREASGDLDAALQDHNEAIRISPDRAETYYNRGLALEASGDLDGALQDYNEAIRLSPDYDDAYNSRGLARQASGDFGGAIQDLNEAIRISPDFADAYYNRDLARGACGDFDGAIQDFNEFISINPEETDAYYNRALIHETEDNNAAAADFQIYLDLGGGELHGGQAEVEKRIRLLKKKP